MEVLVYGGWYGSGNLGDEAILIGVRNIFEKALPETRLKVLSIDPDRTESVCHVEAVKLESPRILIRNRDKYLKMFREAKACLVTGGTPFYDYGHISRIIHMGLPALNRKKLVCFGVGSKRIKTLKGREITRVLLRNSHMISTRDQASKDILAGIIKPPFEGIKPKLLTVTGDSALFVNPRIRRNHEGNTVLLCPRRLASDNRTLYHEQLNKATIIKVRHMQAKAADGLVRQGYDVKFVPFHTVHPDDDREEIRVIRNLMAEKGVETTPRPGSPLDALKLIAGATLVVGLRLHSLVLASSCGVPFTTIDYDIKMRGFMSHMGLGGLCCSPIEGLYTLDEVSLHAAENHLAYSDRIQRRVRDIRSSIIEEADRAAWVIQGLNGDSGKPARLLRGTRSLLPAP